MKAQRRRGRLRADRDEGDTCCRSDGEEGLGMMLVQGVPSLKLRGLASTLVDVILSEWRGGNGMRRLS